MYEGIFGAQRDIHGTDVTLTTCGPSKLMFPKVLSFHVFSYRDTQLIEDAPSSRCAKSDGCTRDFQIHGLCSPSHATEAVASISEDMMRNSMLFRGKSTLYGTRGDIAAMVWWIETTQTRIFRRCLSLKYEYITRYVVLGHVRKRRSV